MISNAGNFALNSTVLTTCHFINKTFNYGHGDHEEVSESAKLGQILDLCQHLDNRLSSLEGEMTLILILIERHARLSP